MDFFFGAKRITEKYLGDKLIYKFSAGGENEEFTPCPTARIIDIFSDVGLANEIRTKLGKSSNNDIITQDDLDTVEVFGYGSIFKGTSIISTTLKNNISNFKGFKYLRKLKYLCLSQNSSSYTFSGTLDLRFCENLESLSCSFYKCSLTEIIMPLKYNPVEMMYYAFAGCANLKRIEIPFSWENITTLSYAFNDCTAIEYVTLPKTLLKTKSYVYSVESLHQTFRNCNKLMTILMPARTNTSTTLTNTYLDLAGRTIIYNEDDVVTHKKQIKYHNTSTGASTYTKATLDYSKLNV